MSNQEKKREAQYFIAIVPPQPVYNDAWKEKLHFKEHYESKASLNSPPHITLHMPFRWREDRENDLTGRLGHFISACKAVPVTLDNYSSFPPRVIFMNVAPSAELEKLYQELKRFCRRELNLFNADYKELPFHPHLTLAFRDLKKSIFPRAWEEFSGKRYHASFIVSTVALLKHNGKTWDVFRELALQPA